MNPERRIGSDCHTYITYRYRAFMAVDVTDATFETEVMVRSHQVPVIVDLWAPWCGPCKTLGPILEKATDATMGQVVLAKVNVDENPQISQAFQVQSIPAVFIMRDGKVLDSFVGAQPEHVVLQIVQSLLPDPMAQKIQELLAAGDENSLRDALVLAPHQEDVVCALAEYLVRHGGAQEALQLLPRLPETERVRGVAAAARLALNPVDDFDATLARLLDQVKVDEVARQEFLDILQTMGPHDPRTGKYRKLLTARLY